MYIVQYSVSEIRTFLEQFYDAVLLTVEYGSFRFQSLEQNIWKH